VDTLVVVAVLGLLGSSWGYQRSPMGLSTLANADQEQVDRTLPLTKDVKNTRAADI
jgi:hypothetical protein